MPRHALVLMIRHLKWRRKRNGRIVDQCENGSIQPHKTCCFATTALQCCHTVLLNMMCDKQSFVPWFATCSLQSASREPLLRQTTMVDCCVYNISFQLFSPRPDHGLVKSNKILMGSACDLDTQEVVWGDVDHNGVWICCSQSGRSGRSGRSGSIF